VHTFTQILTALRESDPAFNSVILVQEPISDQLFFLNVGLLCARCPLRDYGQGLQYPQNSRDQWTNFVELHDNPALMSSPPERLSVVLSELCRDTKLEHMFPPPVALSLSPSLDITLAVPLAAFLLDYPVAYVPISADQSDFLAGISLDVYRCTFALKAEATQSSDLAGREHTLLKFSCPSAIGHAHGELSSQALVETMRNRFGRRLAEAGFPDSIVVEHHTETHARVSL